MMRQSPDFEALLELLYKRRREMNRRSFHRCTRCAGGREAQRARGGPQAAPRGCEAEPLAPASRGLAPGALARRLGASRWGRRWAWAEHTFPPPRLLVGLGSRRQAWLGGGCCGESLSPVYLYILALFGVESGHGLAVSVCGCTVRSAILMSLMVYMAGVATLVLTHVSCVIRGHGRRPPEAAKAGRTGASPYALCLKNKIFLASSPPPRLETEPTRTQERWDCPPPPLALTAQDSVPR